jgi:hypothetical protein
MNWAISQMEFFLNIHIYPFVWNSYTHIHVYILKYVLHVVVCLDCVWCRIYCIFLNTPHTFFPKNSDQKLGCTVYLRITKFVMTCLHQDEQDGASSIHAMVWMCLKTSHGQCPIETFTFPPMCQAKPANHRVRMYISWWGQHIHILWKWVQKACVYDLSWLVKTKNSSRGRSNWKLHCWPKIRHCWKLYKGLEREEKDAAEK